MNPKAIQALFGVEGKVALVTGGTSGIGLMMAEALVAGGAKTYIVARNADDCARTAAELGAGGECHGIAGDLSTLNGVNALARAFGAAEDRLDILVQAAGVLKVEPLEEASEETWDATMNLNLKAPFFLTQKLLPHLRKAGDAEDPARVILVGSGQGIRTSPMENYAYQSGKAGLHHLARKLAGNLVKDHINVNAIAPGIFASRNTADFTADMVAAIVKGVPIGRYGEGSDAAGAVLYLASRAGAYVTGAVLSVDGGRAGIG